MIWKHDSGTVSLSRQVLQFGGIGGPSWGLLEKQQCTGRG